MLHVPTYLRILFETPLLPVLCLDTQKKTILSWKSRFHRYTAPPPSIALSDMTGLEAPVCQALDTLGQLAKVDRVHIWTTTTPESAVSALDTTEPHAWSLCVAPARNTPLSTTVRHHSEDALHINDLIRSLLPKESPGDTLSVMAAPIVFQNRLWGFIGFDDCHTERIWTDTEKNILRASATLIGNVLDNHHVLMEAHATALHLEEVEQAGEMGPELLEHDSADNHSSGKSLMTMNPLSPQTDFLAQRGHYLQSLTDSAKTLLHILNDVLDFSNAEAGKLTVHNTPFPIRNDVQEIYEAALCHSRKKNLAVDFALSESVPKVLIGDARLLNHVLRNLISNAITFTERGTVSLSIDIQHKDEDHSLLHCTVSDTGIGLKNEHIDRIFTPFAQIGAPGTQKGSGMGIGLALCKKLIEAMGGTIRCESALGIGSTFSFHVTVGTVGTVADTTHKPSCALPSDKTVNI